MSNTNVEHQCPGRKLMDQELRDSCQELIDRIVHLRDSL